MLRLCCRTTRRCFHFSLLRRSFSSSPSSSLTKRNPEDSVDYPNNFKNSQRVPPPPILHHNPTLLSPPPSSLSCKSLVAISATLVSAIIASYALILQNDDVKPRQHRSNNPIYNEIEHAIDYSNESFKRIVHRFKQTGVAASVLWKSLRSVLSSANHEVRVGFELRVASFLADIVAANEIRRASIVGAGGGAVVDWLLETVAVSGDNIGTQVESARALAYLVADPNVSEKVLGRPHAVPNLLRFIFSAQPQKSKKQTRHSSFDISDSLKGRSMLVAAIMDVVTSNCDTVNKVSFKPSLPRNAEMRDIAAAIEVIEEGAIHLDETQGSEEDKDGGEGMRGIGIKVLGGTTVLGLSRTDALVEMEHSDGSHLTSVKYTPKNLLFKKFNDSFSGQENLSSAVVPGLWDDLHCQHVAVPFAAWALANWAMASEVNRSHIQELDRDGHAVMTALTAPERSVKWHGSLVARLLLEDHNLPLNDSVSEWSSSLLSTVSQASKTEDISLAQMALSAFLVSIERSPGAQEVVMEKGLPLMRETAKQTTKHKPVQEALAKALESLCARNLHLSLEESQKWSGILLPWVFQKPSSDILLSSATNILSHILEDYGPSALPISQGWLAIMLTDILGARKTASTKGSSQPKSDKVKTQIDQSNIISATQIANQLAGAVVNLAGTQMGTATDNDETFPLADLLSLEPFAGPLKNLKKDSLPKFDAADSALATLKGIKALTELCAEDFLCQNRIADFGVLCLLKRFLLGDDYEQLAAIEAYDASRDLEAQDRGSAVPRESSVAESNDSSRVRVPPTAHIRRHAARLLTILSVLPKVQKVIVTDEVWFNWLEECAKGRIPGCNDLKIQSYAKATLLNIFCSDQNGRNPANDNVLDSSIMNTNHTCPHYADMIFLINPELPHWKCPGKKDLDITSKRPTEKSDDASNSVPGNDDYSVATEDGPLTRAAHDDSSSTSTSGSESCSQSEFPPLDVVFVHGLRGGPFKTWRLSEDKSSTKSGLVEKIDEEAGKQGTFWPGEWLPADFPHARLFSIKYKTNLTQWSGASLPLQVGLSYLTTYQC
ncbi:unnamed protein product [Ilex paraguariensis]|uniref:Alpha/beta-Hydrolases superfamily protein n=1 Tax=Ilex paraguariensis TaxID=185542 RepID=A0ABC8T981_9AQUA